MKNKIKLTLIAFAAVMIFCGFKYSNREGNAIPSDGQQMEILHFHGHTYVCYRFYYSAYRQGGYGGASIVHDPDCKCGKGGGR
ncbi:MAG: hypothetical protein K2M41_02310 [Muribaculaceae bacterium]|nr:hypothetical protein [Muribaculaceae bacterium]